MKRAPRRRPRFAKLKVRLLDLRFLELDVLARDRIIFLERKLVGLGAGVLLGDVEIAGVGGREQLDLERGGLGHGGASLKRGGAPDAPKKAREGRRPVFRRQNSQARREVTPPR